MLRNYSNTTLSQSHDTSLLGLAWYTLLGINISHLSITGRVTHGKCYICFLFLFPFFFSQSLVLLNFYFSCFFLLFSAFPFTVLSPSFFEISFTIFILRCFDVSYILLGIGQFHTVQENKKKILGGRRGGGNSLMGIKNCRIFRFCDFCLLVLFCIFILMC